MPGLEIRHRHQVGEVRHLHVGCEVCGGREHLSRCEGCNMAKYCGAEHQASDWPEHKHECEEIQFEFKRHKGREKFLREFEGDHHLNPPYAFENPDAIGRFGEFLYTRHYTQSRMLWVFAMLALNNKHTIEYALENAEDILRFCRCDLVDLLKHRIASLYLRLGRDQDCYDYIKCWTFEPSRTGRKPDDPRDSSRPWLHTRNEDVLEDLEPFAVFFSNPSDNLSYIAALTLLKLHILIDLQTLQQARKEIGRVFPQEIFDMIQERAVSPVISANGQIMKSQDHTDMIETIREQVRFCFNTIADGNRYFWPVMLDRERYTYERPENIPKIAKFCKAHGFAKVNRSSTDNKLDASWSDDEDGEPDGGDCATDNDKPTEEVLKMKYAVIDSWEAYAETPGALDIVDELWKQWKAHRWH